MDRLPQNRYRNASLGLTLVEVLIALAICAIAVTAVIKATSQNIRGTNHLEDKTESLWFAENIINEIRAGVIKPEAENNVGNREMLGRQWYYKASIVETPNPHIKKITVKVYDADPSSEEKNPLITLESYVYNA